MLKHLATLIVLILSLTLLFIGLNYIGVFKRFDFKYEIKVSDGKYPETYYTDEYHKDSTGCITFIHIDKKQHTACGTFQIIQNN